MSTREDGDGSVEMPADSLPIALDDDEEMCLEGNSAHEEEHSSVNEHSVNEDSDEEDGHKTVVQYLL
jgi:hypothetical protein